MLKVADYFFRRQGKCILRFLAETAAEAILAPSCIQAIQEDNLIYFQSENPADLGLFAGIFGHFSGKIPLFSAKNRSFPTSPILHCGTLCAFSHIGKIFSESEFRSAKTRGFFTLMASFSFPQAN